MNKYHYYIFFFWDKNINKYYQPIHANKLSSKIKQEYNKREIILHHAHNSHAVK